MIVPPPLFVDFLVVHHLTARTKLMFGRVFILQTEKKKSSGIGLGAICFHQCLAGYHKDGKVCWIQLDDSVTCSLCRMEDRNH